LGIPASWVRWLDRAVAEEELELSEAIEPPAARALDWAVTAAALGVVLFASIVMERAASAIGRRFDLRGIVVGALVLAVVTSLPNAVAAVYLARRGRGAATASTALNSNNLNVVVGLLVPAVVLGLARPMAGEVLTVVWYVGLTALTLGLALARRGLGRGEGWVVIGGYLAFVVALVALT
jgi:cation:H+ antiporter